MEWKKILGKINKGGFDSWGNINESKYFETEDIAWEKIRDRVNEFSRFLFNEWRGLNEPEYEEYRLEQLAKWMEKEYSDRFP